MMKKSRTYIPELKSYYIKHDIRCERCDNKMMFGSQYYAMRKVWIDFTCLGCARCVDLDLNSFNAIMKEFGFKPKAARYVISE
jgi:hypothetical protein